MASNGPDYSVKDVNVLDFKHLTGIEKIQLLGTPLLTTVSASAGAASSVFVFRGIFGEGVIGRFGELIAIIGGTIIGFTAGCIVFAFPSVVALCLVTAFILAALVGGIICVITAFGRKLLSAVQNLWTTIMDKVRGFSHAVAEAVGTAFSKVAKSMCRAYNTVCSTIYKLKEAMKRMDPKQKQKVVEGVVAAAKKAEASIDQATEGFLKDVQSILADISADAAFNDIKTMTTHTKDENSKTLNEALQDLKSASTT